jgi:SAM-dependent methyltransferase
LRERGFAGATAADAALLAAREETGPSRGVLWRPSAALLRAAPHLPAHGRALEVACGSGRNATWLACRGLTTWGVDLLPDALVRARGVAAHAPLAAPIAFAVADATRPLPFPAGMFDVVCGIRYLDRALFPRLARLLAPSGVLVWETFLEAQARFGRPRRPEHLLAEGELERLCRAAGLTAVLVQETIPPGGPALAAIVARAPAP